MTHILDYHIHEKLADTRGSVIYRAQRQGESGTVILKKLKARHPTPSEIAQFKHEYHTIQRINLKGVLKILDMFVSPENVCLVYEDFNGVPLKSVIKEKIINIQTFLDIAVTLSETLGHLHQNDIIHKSITPKHILIKPENLESKITDFGASFYITHENDEIYSQDVVNDALIYISPEQTGRMNYVIDYRTDIYSLGVIFYEMLTGAVPFLSSDPLEIFHAHIAKQVPRPDLSDPGIPGVISDIVLKMLSKSPEDRYQNAFGLKADLEMCCRQLKEKGRFESFDLGQKDIPKKFLVPQKLIGREDELAVLMSSIENIYKGKNSAVIISGSPGVGKSFLVEEIFKKNAIRNGYFISGKYEKFKRDRPYSAIVQAFMGLIKRILTESETNLQRWKMRFLNALGPNGKIITDIIPNLELIIGKQPEIATLEPEETKNRFDLVFEKFVNEFANKDHPVILFLDDLQWVDLPSLQLVEKLITNYRIGYFLFIGSYRDNDLSDAYPLMDTIGRIQQAGITVNTINLYPLNECDIRNLVAATLKYSDDESRRLARILFKKTGGNPFFIKQFLKTVHDETYIWFDTSKGWIYDEEKIMNLQVTDNVVDLMIKKIVKLERRTQEILKVGACIGNRFRLETVSYLLVLPIDTILADISLAVNEGLIYGLNSMYYFYHNRIQEAVYALIPDDKKALYHYKIGKYVLKNTVTGDDLQNKLFYIANQLNSGIGFIIDSSERQELLVLNQAAGKKAKAAAAYDSSLNYLKNAIHLLGENCWEKQYNLALDLHTEAAEVSYLSADFDDMTEMADIVLSHAGSVLDRVKIYEIRAKSYNAQNRPMDVIDEGLNFLEILGCKLPRRPNTSHIIWWLIKARLALGNKQIDKFSKMEDVTDARALSVMRIMATLAQAAYRAWPNLLPIIVLKGVHISLRQGNAPQTPFAFAGYGMILCGKLCCIDKGYALGQLAMQLEERSVAKNLKARTWYLTEVMIIHWKKSLQDSLQSLQSIYRLALENGDIEYATLAATDLCLFSYSTGKRLKDCAAQMKEYENVVKQFKQETHLNYLNINHQAILNLLEETKEPCILNGDAYNEESRMPVHIAAGDETAIFFVYFHKMILCFLFGHYKDAVDHAGHAKKYMDSVIGLPWGPIFYFYESLAWLALLPDIRGYKRKKYQKQIAANQKKMKKWSKYAPTNYLHKYYLVEAETEKIKQNYLQAEAYYHLSIELSHQNGFSQEEALCRELAAKFYMERGLKEIAEGHFIKTHKAYFNWGALAKVRHLETMYPDYLSNVESGQLQQHSGRSLDMYTVMKFVQVISGEIELRRLLKQMMEITMENAGAQKGYMVFNSNNGLVVEAEFTTENGEISLLSSVPLDTHNGISISIVNYVARTKEMLILENASLMGEFVHDPYVIKYQPKSIMCSPILKKGNVSAILYLENNLVDQAFTKDRIEVIQVLTSQAAISFENAMLYEEVYQSEEKYRTILENIEDGYFETDLHGNITFLNDAMSHISGIEKDKLIYSNFQLHVEQENIEKITAAGNKVYQSDEPVRGFEFITKRKDGSSVYVDYSLSLRKDSEGRPIGFRGILRDVTEKKEAERLKIERDVAKETAEAKSGFLANMSHEIRTPLNAIMGFTRSILGTELSDIQARHLDRIQKSSVHLLDIVDSILDLSKMEAGKVQLELIDFQLKDIMDDLDAMFSELIPKGVHFDIIMDDIIPVWLKGDPLRIKQILINLINNALKFTKQGSIIVHVSVEDLQTADQVWLRFSVKDTGIGIPADKFADLFSAYIQADSSTARMYGGTGLGLTISKGLVELMGGEISAESKEGEGTTFSFTICLFYGNEIQDFSRNPAEGMKIINFRGVKILLAEDEIINQELASFILENIGADVTCVSNGREAVDAVNTTPFDAVFMDMQMPVMGGLEATRLIKENPKNKNLPVIAMTGNVSFEDRERCIKSGMAEVVTKPFDEEKFIFVLEKTVAASKTI